MHVLLIVYAPPKQIDRFERWINSLKYPIEGKIRRGYCTPFISKIGMFHDVRIKEEVLKPFLEDLKVSTGISFLSSGRGNCFKHLGSIGTIIRLFLRVVSLISPMDYVDEREIKEKSHNPRLPGWCYAQIIGVITDGKAEAGELL